MRRVLIALVLISLPVWASAQVSPVPFNQAPLFGLPLGQGSASNPFTNISFTGQALGPDSCTAYSFTSAPTTGYGYNGTLLCLNLAGSTLFSVSSTAVTTAKPITFSGGSVLDGITTANTIDQRNGTNAQIFNVHRTYSGSGANYERLSFQSDANLFYGIVEIGGTGAAKGLSFNVATTKSVILKSGGQTLTLNDGTTGIIANTSISGTAFRVNDVLAISGTAPSGPVACTTPAVSWHNGTAVFQIDVGGTCVGISTLVVTLPAAANGWECTASNTTTAARDVWATAWTTTSVTFTNTARTTGLATDWADGADIRIKCMAG